MVQIMPSAYKVFVEKEQLSLDVIKQYRVEVSGFEEKDMVLQEYILKNADKLGQTIIFVASRRVAQALHDVRSYYMHYSKRQCASYCRAAVHNSLKVLACAFTRCECTLLLVLKSFLLVFAEFTSYAS
jgi:superfamily II DNA/RNA helicase